MEKELVLVTGGTGFLAGYVIEALLKQGYAVRATVRALNKTAAVRQTLAAHGVANQERLAFVEADLTRDEHWAQVMAGVDTVMSVAAPVFVDGRRTSMVVKQTATTGIKRILTAAAQAGVRRVVMTANLGAVGFSHFKADDQVTEADWTDVNQRGLSAYEQSKLLAERAAWNFIKQHPELELVTVNAGAMLGPAFGPHVSGSFNLVKRLLTGKAMPNLAVNVVDVRDVAALHVLAMQTPVAAGHRFLAVAEQTVTMRGLQQLLTRQRPELTSQLTKRLVPTGVVWLLAPLSVQLREANLMMRVNHHVSTDQAQQRLGWHPQFSADAAVLATVDSLVTLNQID
ncbi:NAD-dependent epimerase/dehydratase family protein [Lactiplantibacillus garii]|uniref:NAD-dependent epimerase/dehydratase family protein n=1 Tax=Lactiplantibacillus garii TaxID=2306423 RepID=A0A3R8KH83_9LACO|nr:NAD-dependent epimerase/dehydratase family protein [Lactiplantibacillus garii]RRK09754.1 NAD-dependent epimerase/dehydratase family protein [Lactiplantibacillus garii]